MNPFAVVAERAAPRSSRIDVPARFVDFLEWLGVAPSEAQRVVCGVAYDGDDIPDTPLARRIFGRAGPVSAEERGIVAAVCGGRGGKSYVLVALRLLHGMLTRDLSSLAPGQRAVSLVIAPRDSLRQEVVNYVRGAIASHAGLRGLLLGGADDVGESVRIRRPDGRLVTLEGGVATHGGYGGRGRSLTDVALDEVAFFRDASYRVNDRQIFEAASARVLPGGQAILASTPWAEAGLLHEVFTANHGKAGGTALAFRATTEELNPSPWAKQIVERERRRDPENARREFDAHFMTGQTTVFFDAALIAACTDPSLDGGRMPKPGELVRAGADAGFRSDSSALAVAHLSGMMILIGELLEMRPEPGKPLVPSEVVRTFRDRCHAHGASYLTADGHYREAIVEHLGTIGFADAPAAPHEAFVRCRTLMREGRVRFPPNERLLRQLREVEARPLPGGGMAIHMPRWRTGGHGDLAQALVLAVSSFGGEPIAAPAPSWGSPEWEAAEQEKRRRELEAKRDDRYTRAPWKRR